MDNDKAFIVYALVIFTGVATIMTTVLATSAPYLPSPLNIVEHLALSLGFRAAYKTMGGGGWEEWSLMSHRDAHVDVDGADVISDSTGLQQA